MWLLALALACSGPADSGSAEAEVRYAVSSLFGNAWFVSDAEGAEVLRYDLTAHHPECVDESRYCMVYQARHRGDEVVYTWSPVDASDGDEFGREDRIGRVAAVGLDDLAERWRLERLDWSGVPGAVDLCEADPADPCAPAAGLDDHAVHRCLLYQPHDVQVISEDEAGVELWIADTRAGRALRVRVPQADTCGEVLEVLDRSVGGWGHLHAVNALQYAEAGGTRELLLSVKDTLAGVEPEQRGGDGRGKLALWRDAGGGWAQVWEFPPASETEASFVNAPHGVDWLERDDGERWVVFAHSLGRSDDWDRGPGGSVGVLAVEGDAVRYLYDGVLPGTDLQYPRDVAPRPDGTAVVVDSGCKGGFSCDRPVGAWVVDLPDAEPAEVDGVWTPDHARQRFVEVEVARGPWWTGERVPYSAEPF